MKTTPTLGLKLYDGTDAPDFVAGYNASMSAIDGSGVLASQGTVQDSTDWDTIVDAGYYQCNNTQFSSANHSPVGSYNYGILVVYKRCDASNCVTQIYYPHAANFANRAPVSRAYYSNAWSEWAPLVYVPDVEGALPANGAAGQVLVKSSASDYDCVWTDPTALNTMVSYDGNTNCLLANGTEVAALKMPSIEGLEQLNGVQLATAAITSEEEMTDFLVGATKYGAWVGSGTVSHRKVYAGGPVPCACNAFRQDNVDALNLVITGITPTNLDMSTFQIVAFGNGKSQSFTLSGIILTYEGDGGAPTQTRINKFSDLSGINLKLSRMANS